MAEEEEPPLDGRRGRRRKIGGTCRSFFNPDELLRSSPLPSQKATKRKKWLTEESVDIATSSLAIVPSASPSPSLSKRAGGRGGGGGLSDPTPVKRRRSSKGFVWTDSDTDMEDAIEDLHKELEEERTATATAVSETMAMITRLQEERSALEMAANQYKRVAEEKEAHDKGTIALLEDLLMKEKEKVTRTLSRKRLPSQTLLIGNGNPEPDPTSDLDPECDPEYDPEFNPENDLEYDSEFDPEYDPEFDPENDPEFDPEFDSAYDPEFDSAYDPEYNPENDPEYENDPKYNLEGGLDDGDDEDGVELVEKRIISLREMAPNFLDDEASTDSPHCLSITRNPSTEEFKPAKEEEEEENTENNYGSNNLKGFGIILPDSDNPSYLPSIWNRINEIEEKLQFLTRHQKETELSSPARSKNKKNKSQEAKGQSYQSPNKVKDAVVDSHEAEHKDLAEAQEMRIVPDNLPSFGEQKNGKREEAWKTVGDEEEVAVSERVEALKSEGERMMQEIDRLRKENEELKSVQDLGMQLRGGMKGGNVDESKASFAQTQKEGSLLVIIFKAFLSFIGLDRQKRKWEFPSRTRNAKFSQDKNRVLYWRINNNSPIIIKNKGNWSLNIAITANIEIC